MVVIPVMEGQDRTHRPHYREPSGQVFEERCDYLARSICNVHKGSELCVGYFFVDIPGRARHETGVEFPCLKSLSKKEREGKIYGVAGSYCNTMCNSVRKVDPNHLIFGDRYNGNMLIPTGVLKVMTGHKRPCGRAQHAILLRADGGLEEEDDGEFKKWVHNGLDIDQLAMKRILGSSRTQAYSTLCI